MSEISLPLSEHLVFKVMAQSDHFFQIMLLKHRNGSVNPKIRERRIEEVRILHVMLLSKDRFQCAYEIELVGIVMFVILNEESVEGFSDFIFRLFFFIQA